jgi:hypothetical protein
VPHWSRVRAAPANVTRLGIGKIRSDWPGTRFGTRYVVFLAPLIRFSIESRDEDPITSLGGSGTFRGTPGQRDEIIQVLQCKGLPS